MNRDPEHPHLESNHLGFTWRETKQGDIIIRHHGREAAVLRGGKAEDFLGKIGRDGTDAQQIMARLTGNYKRGNERSARDHPRNNSSR